MTTNGNHPAFESRVYHTKYSDSAERFPGLTKREYFAAMAMRGLLHIEKPSGYRDDVSTRAWMARVALTSCIAADALIAALNDGGEE